MNYIKTHWETIYSEKQDNEVSWFQENPSVSLALIEKYNSSGSVIDIGGGNSLLAGELVKKGYTDITVLDISSNALERSRSRIKEAPVNWIEGNILDCNTLPNVDIWHDRAVFHFLVADSDIRRYVAIAAETVKKDGHLIMGTFSESGPDKCSGLIVSKYSASRLASLFNSFRMVESFKEDHVTPSGSRQNFTWCVFKKSN